MQWQMGTQLNISEVCQCHLEYPSSNISTELQTISLHCIPFDNNPPGLHRLISEAGGTCVTFYEGGGFEVHNLDAFIARLPHFHGLSSWASEQDHFEILQRLLRHFQFEKVQGRNIWKHVAFTKDGQSLWMIRCMAGIGTSSLLRAFEVEVTIMSYLKREWDLTSEDDVKTKILQVGQQLMWLMPGDFVFVVTWNECSHMCHINDIERMQHYKSRAILRCAEYLATFYWRTGMIHEAENMFRVCENEAKQLFGNYDGDTKRAKSSMQEFYKEHPHLLVTTIVHGDNGGYMLEYGTPEMKNDAHFVLKRLKIQAASP